MRVSEKGTDLTPVQAQVDAWVGGFVRQATDGKSLAAMTAGGLAYRAGRIGVLGLGTGSALRAASVGVGLTAEVSAFEMSHRILQSQNSHLWRWNGNGGLRQGLLQSFVTFGALKGAGRLTQGENLIAQHLFQDMAMVLGHQATGALGVTARPSGSLAEQFLHAEATNLQIGAGMALSHRVAPGLQSLERGLDLALRSQGPSLSHPKKPLVPLGLELASQGLKAVPFKSREWDHLILTMSTPEDPDLRPSGAVQSGQEGRPSALLGYKALFEYSQERDFKDFRTLFRALDSLEEEGAPIDFNIIVDSIWQVLGASPAEIQNQRRYLVYQETLEGLMSKGKLKGFAVMPVYNAIMTSRSVRDLNSLIQKMNQSPVAHALLKIEIYRRVAASEHLSPRTMGSILKDLKALGGILHDADLPIPDLSSAYMNLVRNKNFSGRGNIREVVQALPLMVLPGAGASLPAEILKSLLGVKGFRLQPHWREIQGLILSLPHPSDRLNFLGDLASEERFTPADVALLGQEIASHEPLKAPDPESRGYENYVHQAAAYAGALGELGSNPHSRNFPILLHRIRSVPTHPVAKARALLRVADNPYFEDETDFRQVLEEILKIKGNPEVLEAFIGRLLRNGRFPKHMVDEVWGGLGAHHPGSLTRMVLFYRSLQRVN